MRTMWRALLPGIVALVVSCRAETGPAANVLRRDSSGVAIVESRAPASQTLLQLAPEPVVTIGAVENDSTQLVDGVVNAVRLSDGRIVIANRLPPLLRWYDGGGHFLYGAGRVGGGPGDFSGEGLGIGGMWRMRGDSIAAWDILRRRMQIFDAQGKYARAFSPKPPPGWRQFFAPRIVGIHADSILIASSNVSSSPSGVIDIWRDTVQYAQWRLDGEYLSELAQLPGVENYTPAFQQRVRGTPPAGPGAPPPPPGPPPPFARAGVAAASRDRWYYASADGREIRTYLSTREPVLLLRRVTPQYVVTAAMKEAFARDWLARATNNPALQRDMQRWIDAALYPDSLPSWRRIVVSADSSVWAQEYDVPEAATITWSIFQRDGTWLTDITVPSSLRILDISAENIIGVLRDDLDVETVRVYRLQRSSN